MSGYYPDGVTGNEFAIAGADGNMDITSQEVYCNNEQCAEYDEAQWVDIIDAEYYGSNAWGVWKCPTCETEQEWEGEVPQEEQEYEPEDNMMEYGDDY